MFGKRGLAMSAALGMVALGSPSYALDFESLLRNYLGGTTQPLVTSQQAELKLAINDRQAQLERDIEAGVRSGQLTAAEETDLRNALNHVGFIEGTALSDGTLTSAETDQVIDDLTNVSNRLHTYLSNATVSGYAATMPRGGNWSSWLGRYTGRGRGDVAVSNQPAVQAIIDTRQAELGAAIEQGMVQGTLNWDDARSMRSELTKNQTLESTMLADGKLTVSEEQQLVASLNSLDTLLKSKTVAASTTTASYRGRHHRGGVNRTQSAIRRRIDRGVASGKLTRTEADRLLSQESQIRDLERQMRGTGRGLSYSEQSRLMSRLDRLSANLNRQLTDKQIW